MKYMLALIGDESRFADRSPEWLAENMKRWDAYTTEAIEAGVHLAGEGLDPSSTATTVRIGEDGEPTVFDGPFAETKEQLGGFYLFDVKDRDEAIAWAKKLPFPGGAAEVRPVMDYDAVGSTEHSNKVEARR